MWFSAFRVGATIVLGILVQSATGAAGPDKQALRVLPEPTVAVWSMRPTGDADRAFPVEIRLFETTYSQSDPIDLQNPKTPLSGDEEFLRRFFLTNATGKPEEILNLWGEADRGAVRTMMNDPELSGPSRKYYAQVTHVRFVRKIHYGSYRLLLIDVSRQGTTESRPDVYVLLRVGERICATNALQNDPTRAFIEQLLRAGAAPSSVK